MVIGIIEDDNLLRKSFGYIFECRKNRNIVNTQRVSAFRIFYYEPEPGSYKRDDNGKYMGNR